MRPLTRLILAAAIVLVGCAGSTPGLDTLPSQDGDWIKAKRHFEEGHTIRAIEELTAYVEAHPGSNKLDEALLYLGLSRQKARENELAIESFNRLIRDFPQSEFRERAEFERAQSRFDEALSPPKDPEATETALSLFRGYLLRYPEGFFADRAKEGIDQCLERLALKSLMNAETYLRLNRDRAAVIYLEKSLETKVDFSRAGEAFVELARARERLGDLDKAREAWSKFIEYATPERIEAESDLERWRVEALAALRRLPQSSAEEQTR